MQDRSFGRYLLQAAAALTLLAGTEHVVAQEPPPPPDAGAPTPDEPVVPDEPGLTTPDGGVPEPDGGITPPAEVPPAAPVAAEPVAEPKAEPGEIVVTGSRIRRTSFAPVQSVTVMDRKQLQQSGATDLTDIIKNMVVNSGSEITPGLAGTAAGSSQFNLRGLGPARTLVLLNGRRVVQAAVAATDGANYVDINTLPLAAVERIEVLKGGGSAIYGSDAVAGVVNIITRKHMDGFEGQVGAQTTDRLDQHEWDASLMGGATGETTRSLVLLNYMKREPLLANDRAFTQLDAAHGGNWSSTPTPGLFTPTGMGMGLPRFRDPGCGNVPLSMRVDIMGMPPSCRFNFNDFYYLVPEDQRFNLFGSLEQDIGNHATLFFEGTYARNRSRRIISPSLQLNQGPSVPATNLYNPTGLDLGWTGRIRGAGYPPWTNFNDQDTLNAVAGVKGDFGAAEGAGKFAEWNWELAGSWSATQFDARSRDTVTSYLQNSLNSCNPNDATFNPANCWNPFSFGAPNSEALFDRISNENRTISRNELTTLNLDFNGPLVTLPGGDLSLAIGGQVRRGTTDVNYDHLINQGEGQFGGRANDFAGERKVWAGYGELMIPVVEAMEIQAAGRVEQNSDVGSSGFKPTLGLAWTPVKTFLGEKMPQIADVRLRGTYSESFVAPSLLQTQGASNTSQQLTIPGAGTNFVVVRTEGNSHLKPQSSTAITTGLEWRPLRKMLVGGEYWRYNFEDIVAAESAQAVVNADAMNPNPAQVSKAGGVVQGVTVSYINGDKITTDGVDLELNYQTDFGAPSAGTWSFGATASYIMSYVIPRAQYQPTGRAIALGSACTGQAEYGAWKAAFDAAPMTMKPPPPNPKGYTCDVAGLKNTSNTNFARALPRLRMNVPLAWSLGGHSVSAIGHFISAYKNDQLVPALTPNPANPAVPLDATNAPFQEIVAFVTLDLQYSFRLKETKDAATTFRVGVNNVFDTPPPTVWTNLGFDSQTHDPRGRMIYARLIQEL